MGRVKEVRNYVNAEIFKMDKKEKIPAALDHLYGVSLAATILAKKRGLPEEIAAIAGMLHDIAAYQSGSYEDHAHKGAIIAKEMLREIGVTNEEENNLICSAIYHHDDKNLIDSPFDELLKDADVIDHCFNESAKPIKEKEKERYDALCQELSLFTNR